MAGKLGGMARIVGAMLWLGAPVVAEPFIGPPPPPVERVAPDSRITGFQDWALDCTGPCVLTHVIRGVDPDATDVLRLSLRRGVEQENPVLTLTTPLPLYLPDPLILTPEGEDPRPVPWLTCVPEGCAAQVALDGDLLEALRRRRHATVEVTLVDGSHARLTASLLGLTAALKALEAKR